MLSTADRKHLAPWSAMSTTLERRAEMLRTSLALGSLAKWKSCCTFSQLPRFFVKVHSWCHWSVAHDRSGAGSKKLQLQHVGEQCLEADLLSKTSPRANVLGSLLKRAFLGQFVYQVRKSEVWRTNLRVHESFLLTACLLHHRFVLCACHLCLCACRRGASLINDCSSSF